MVITIIIVIMALEKFQMIIEKSSTVVDGWVEPCFGGVGGGKTDFKYCFQESKS
jgi:hypothetical protein